MLNTCALERPPQGGGVSTVTLTLPGLAMSEARTCASSCVGLTNVVARGELFHITVASFVKCSPNISSVKAAPPAVATLGCTEIVLAAVLMVSRFSMAGCHGL